MTASITCPRCGAESVHPQDIAERYCGRCHHFHKISPLVDGLILAGGLYRCEADGGFARVSDAGAEPDVHICRRLEDFPGGVLPPGAVADTCADCGAVVGRQPERRGVMVVCLQCRSIEPLAAAGIMKNPWPFMTLPERLVAAAAPSDGSSRFLVLVLLHIFYR